MHTAQTFIINTLISHGNIMDETELNNLIRAKYDPYWGRTDRSPWGNVPERKVKWKQNVAAAKAGLDRKGVVILYVYHVKVPAKNRRTGKRYRYVKRQARVYLGRNYRTVIAAVFGRANRDKKWKRSYEQLDQPRAKYIVPR